ncbi:PP2C family protein-serine/threonine phosphatase [Nocardiopsis sp. CT-R113]|uniref:PP2C family protein-serine/threonine phosphatase n=1 Tax=Nocardiopsis codii TaxID=3065942 RepID=A0ABU7K4I6_9ACTN|nr:PP2C family protein-serine/threonine phosphatase [Nocardiopsis sp. CT-R113]MEE2037135.1 PP2C family protein-serine/threonine phosphatase [Nocardiopsis sp. CT-R113]
MGGGAPISDSELLFEELVRSVHGCGPMEVLESADRYSRAIGLAGITVHLVDLQQHLLVPLTGGPSLDIDSTEAGEAYRSDTLRLDEGSGGELSLWLPLRDGADRMGVLHVRAPSLDEPTLRRCQTLASLLALIVTSKRAYSDTYVRHTRTRPVQLRTEMLRAFLPPRTLGTTRGVSTAVLEPAYELGGDAFDHSITKDTLHAVILDAMGHDLASGLTASVAMAGARGARRNGADLAELTASVEKALVTWLPERFCTGVFATLELATGVFSWANCAHPTPLLIRDRRLVAGALEREPEVPLGLGGVLADTGARTVHRVQLEPGDQVLLYTDGVTEAHDSHGQMFGLEQFADFVIRAASADEPAPETLRRLIHAIHAHQRGSFNDDATIMLLEWHPEGTGVPRPRGG